MSGNNTVSSEGSSSRGNHEAREDSMENNAPRANNNPEDITEIKQVLDTLTKKAQAQETDLQALKKQKHRRSRVRLTRLSFTTPRAYRRNRHKELPPQTDRIRAEDLPPPSPRQESDETPERVIEESDEDQRPRRQIQTNTAADNDMADGEGAPTLAEFYRREQERRAPQGSRLDRIVSDLRTTKLQMYRSTRKAPRVAFVLEKARNTPSAENIARAEISDLG